MFACFFVRRIDPQRLLELIDGFGVLPVHGECAAEDVAGPGIVRLHGHRLAGVDE